MYNVFLKTSQVSDTFFVKKDSYCFATQALEMFIHFSKKSYFMSQPIALGNQ